MNNVLGYLVMILATVHNICATVCNSSNKEKVGRVVFGEASGEPADGQLEVAFTIINRMNHVSYPNTLNGVLYQTYTSGGKKRHLYNTLDNPDHDERWAAAKHHKAVEHAAYEAAITAAGHALCATNFDPMSCGPVSFCALNPCSSTNSNTYWCVTEKRKIGKNWFACIEKNFGQC
ncbi:unnamed protein product [Mytilus coruscus]|uniref:Cell wall hydrolase SleB domain-containing protein n=1 Tax=Mytilus coruscus TaxID=42192 RepID=A0A6J8B9S0_MYTCO|nr:unnamed protein product [Mytilus coruscus]